MAKMPIREPKDGSDLRNGTLFYDLSDKNLYITNNGILDNISSFEQLPEGWVDVKKDFGAKGDGVTDDTEAIQNAINSGKNVFIPPGTYILTSELQMQHNGTIIMGTGRHSTILKFQGCNGIYINGKINIHIYHMEIQGDNTEILVTAETKGIYENNYLRWLRVENVHISGFGRAGIYTDNGSIFSIFRNLSFTDNGRNSVDTAKGSIVLNSTGTFTTGLNIENVYCQNGAGYGIYGSKIAHGKITNFIVEHHSEWGYIRGGSNIVISNSYAEANTSNTLTIDDSHLISVGQTYGLTINEVYSGISFNQRQYTDLNRHRLKIAFIEPRLIELTPFHTWFDSGIDFDTNIALTQQSKKPKYLTDIETLHTIMSIDDSTGYIDNEIALPPLSSAPSSPKEGQIAFADGTNWNPGSGKGLYIYYDSTWHKIG